MKSQKIAEALSAIQDHYHTDELLYDGMSYDIVCSICTQYLKNGKVSEKQVNALQAVIIGIHKHGYRDKPTPKSEPDGVGFLGLNCRTGEVNWHTWQIFETY